jgi:hypothetical protein
VDLGLIGVIVCTSNNFLKLFSECSNLIIIDQIFIGEIESQLIFKRFNISQLIFRDINLYGFSKP